MTTFDTGEPVGVPLYKLGQLRDVDSATTADPVEKATLLWDDTGKEWKGVAPSAVIAATSAITGGEAPTEAEFNALQTKFNTLLTACIAHGITSVS